MIKRILAFIFGCFFLILLYMVGKNSVDTSTTSSVMWFGLASAVLAPIGLGFLGYAFLGNDRDQLSKLTKVTEIEKLIDKAETEEEKFKRLQDERKQLDTIIRFEVERRTLESRRVILEKTAEDIFKELEIIDEQLADLGIKVEQGITGDQIKKLKERIDAVANEDIVFRIGTNQLIIRKKFVTNLPFYGNMIFYALRLLASINTGINRIAVNRDKNVESD